MTAIDAEPVDLVCKLPPGVSFLGEALKPVAKNLRRALAKKKGRSRGQCFVVPDDLARHMGLIHQALENLAPRIKDLMTKVCKDANSGITQAYRAASRLEQVLVQFVQGYHDALACDADFEGAEERDLIVGVYRHHLREIALWLDELVNAIADPLAAMEKRRIPAASKVTLSVSLNLTPPPQMVILLEMARRLPPERPPPYQPVGDSPGVLATIGALAFGFRMAKFGFGRRLG